jgi:2-hydroxy-6-oxonona-2,4-dienedioate hydrolase
MPLAPILSTRHERDPGGIDRFRFHAGISAVSNEEMEDATAFVSRIEARAARSVTPAGGGSMVWRSWGEGPPLVLLHGASGSWTHWIRNIPPLAERFRVLAPDMPGFGDSDSPPEPHTADGLADLLAASLDVILPPPTRLDLAGFSFGAIIAGLVAARLGNRVSTLALVGTGGLGLGLGSARRVVRIESIMSPEEIRNAHRENLLSLMLAKPESADDLAVSLQIENLRRARFKSGTIPQSDVLRQALPLIRARIAGIWGGSDAFADGRLEACRRVLASAQTDFDFRVIEGAGHWVPYEAAHQINAALFELLGR